MNRRRAIGILGVGFTAGCLSIVDSVTSSSDRYSVPGSVPLNTCKGVSGWSTFQGSPRRIGNINLTLEKEPTVIDQPSKGTALGRTGMVVCTEEYIFWHQKQATTVYRTHTSTGRTDSLSLDSAIRVDSGLACSYLIVHTNSGVAWIDIDTWDVVSKTPTASPHTGTLVDESFAYIPGIEGGLQAYSIESGESEWFVEVQRLVTGLSSSRECLFVVDSSDRAGSLRAIEKETGETRWESELVGETYSSPVVGSRVFLRDNTGTLHALNKENGEIEWSIGFSTTDPFLVPASSDGIVYYPDGSTGTVTALDSETGERRWRSRIPTGDASSTTLSSPICTEESVLVGASPGGLVALTKDTGEKKWQVTTYPIESNLAATTDSIYALTSSGILEATHKTVASNGQS